jgi:hypothetical protein
MCEKQMLYHLSYVAPFLLVVVFFFGWKAGRHDGIRYMMKRDKKYWEEP